MSWDALLKTTDIELELMTDVNQFQFLEKGTRGGTDEELSIRKDYGESAKESRCQTCFGSK